MFFVALLVAVTAAVVAAEVALLLPSERRLFILLTDGEKNEYGTQ